MKNWIAPNPELLPGFIIGGAMKCGTSTLHEILHRHPKVFMPKEEVHFFDIDNILQHSDFNFHIDDKWITQSMDDNPKLFWDWYQEKFKGNESLLKGEDSTTYLASPVAAERISLQKNDIKLIFLLRQPSLRAYSHYNHSLRTGRATYSFEDTLRFNPYQVLSRSLYKEQIENYYKFIPKSRIKIILFEDFIKETEAALKEVCAFLDLEYAEFPADLLDTHANKARIPKNSSLQIRKKLLMRDFGNKSYTNKLPIKVVQKKSILPFFLRVVNKVHSKINPALPIRPPQINPETKVFLDNYFHNELKGINELIDKDVMSKWFPN